MTEYEETTLQAGDKRHWLWRHPFLTLIGTLTIGALGNGIWEAVMRPAFSSAFNFILDIITFGSSALQDAAYAAAAIDQTAAPAHNLLSLTVGFLSVPFVFFVIFELGLTPMRYVRSKRAKYEELETQVGKEERNAQVNRDIAKLRRYRRILVVVMGVTLGFMLARLTIDRQSLKIWQSFQCDMRMCAPFLTETEEEELQSKYAAMMTRAEFQKLIARLREIAEQNSLQLRSANLW